MRCRMIQRHSAWLLGCLVLAPTTTWAELTQTQSSVIQCINLEQFYSNQTLSFALFHSSIPGQLATTTHQFTLTEGGYAVSSSSEAKGLLTLFYSGQLTQSSEGKILPQQGLSPKVYREQRGNRPTQTSEVNHEKHNVFFSRTGQTTAWVSNAQDRLSLIYQLSALLKCLSPMGIPRLLSIPIITTSQLEYENFQLNQASLLLQTTNQTLQTWVLSNQGSTKDEIIRLWFDRTSFRPLQIQIEDSQGKQLTQVLKEAKPSF